ncbi:deaminase domain-containing protein [Paenibacillus sinopodophylli]|uniref:deaminase domain-containing protein n=1 Tax=Paenibacillus sinopodophylli TaxID=1837342 RepID=UPI001FE92550|nr:deaminase domain-containing protein [Paenibacillus sinopodophylli]
MLGHNQSQALLDGYFPFNPFHKGIDFAAYQRSDQDYYGRINGCPAPSAIELYQWQMAKKINDAKWKVIAGIGSFVQGGIDAITGTVDGVMDIAKNIREGNIEELPSFLTNNPEKARKEAQALIDEFNESVINGDTDSRLNYAGGIIIPSLLSAGIGKGLQLVLKRAPKVPKSAKREPIPSKVDDITLNVDEHLKPNQDKPLDTEGTGEAGSVNRVFREATEEDKKLIDDVRQRFNAGKTKNVALTKGEIDGELINLESMSGYDPNNPNHKDNYPRPPENHYKYSGSDNKGRLQDTEQKMIEYLRERFKNNPDVEGSIEIISHNPICISCNDIIDQFRIDFPNIKVTRVQILDDLN